MLDYGEVVVHLMFSFERQHYDLEGKFHRAMQVCRQTCICIRSQAGRSLNAAEPQLPCAPVQRHSVGAVAVAATLAAWC